MKFFVLCLLVIQAAYIRCCCTEASTIIQIKNYEGPIYLSPTKPCEDKIFHHHAPSFGCDYDCTCVSKPSCTCMPCVPINTVSQCASGGSVYPNWYQDQCSIQQLTPSLYSVPQEDSYVCGKCGRKYSYY